jgi:lysophospholipase L1-like esterase
MEIAKLETGGDLAHHTPFAIPKRVKWMTDRYGFRKKDLEGTKPRVVIVGDSNILGSRLTQEEMFSEVLEERLKVPVYPYAPVGSINAFLKDSRFERQPPEIVILSIVERNIIDLSAAKQPKKRVGGQFFFKWRDRFQEIRWVQVAGVFLDRLCKMNMLHYVRARIGKGPVEVFRPVPSRFGPMYFLQGEAANREVPEDRFEKAIEALEACKNVLEERGIRFIFAPIPNKESIYYEYLPKGRRPVFLEHLVRELKKREIGTIDSQKAFEDEYRKNGTLLYFLDDTHWNEDGVRLMADLIVKVFEKRQ